MAHWIDRNRLRLSASALLGVPCAVLLLFAVAEMAGGDLSGSQHLAQAAPLLALLAVGWRYPRAAGTALVGVGLLLLLLWLVFVVRERDPSPRGWDVVMWAGAGVLLFLPPLVAGWLFRRTGHGERPSS